MACFSKFTVRIVYCTNVLLRRESYAISKHFVKTSKTKHTVLRRKQAISGKEVAKAKFCQNFRFDAINVEHFFAILPPLNYFASICFFRFESLAERFLLNVNSFISEAKLRRTPYLFGQFFVGHPIPVRSIFRRIPYAFTVNLLQRRLTPDTPCGERRP